MVHNIGVFDSGIGGLTVVSALRKAYPGLNMIYLGDLARAPYGGRSTETIIRYALEDARFLLDKGVEALVVACNTVSSVALEELERQSRLPVYGVIASAARQAAHSSHTSVVGVIGTQATVRSGAYEREILNTRPGVRVLSQACPLLVPLIENGVDWRDEVAELVLRRYLEPFRDSGMDTLVMGCTHYPVYRPLLERLLPGVQLINTGEALSRELSQVFSDYRQGAGRAEYYVTERSAAFGDIVSAIDGSVRAEEIHLAQNIFG